MEFWNYFQSLNTVTFESITFIFMFILKLKKCWCSYYSYTISLFSRNFQFSDPDLFHPAKKVDYFDNVCDYEVRPTKPLPEFGQQNDVEQQTTTTTKIKPMFKPDAQQQTTIKHQDEAKKKTGCEFLGLLVLLNLATFCSNLKF